MAKYQVGDEFELIAGGKALRRVDTVHEYDNGTWYGITYEESDARDLVNEEYIDRAYCQVERFFEPGKRYAFTEEDEGAWDCQHIIERNGKKYAVMFNDGFNKDEPFVMNQKDYKKYRELD